MLIKKKKKNTHPDMVGSPYYPSTGEAESGGSRVGGQPGLHRESLSQTTKSVIFQNRFFFFL
jgi:hypothetical protein